MKWKGIKTASPPMDVFKSVRQHGRMLRPTNPSDNLIYVTGDTECGCQMDMILLSIDSQT